MIVAVAERLYLPNISGQLLTELYDMWRVRPLACCLCFPALPPGPTRTRFDRYMAGHLVSRVVNLLPPDNRPGTWDRPLARLTASELLETARAEGVRLVALGNRVRRTLGHRGVVLEASEVGPGVPCLYLPHPSGRARSLNTQEMCTKVQKAMCRFCL